VKRRSLAALAWTVAASLAATFVFSRGSFDMTWRHFLAQSAGNTLFAGACVLLCVFGLPLLVPFAHRRLRFPFDWLTILAGLITFGVVGSLLAAIVALALGLAQAPLPFMDWYPGSMKISIYFTVIFGLSGTVIEQLRARLAATTVAVRTKERDEAEARRLVAEARLASLESRVDPHFLFNTLNSIAALVRDRPADAERIIEQLSALMRSALDRRSSLVPVHDELEIVRSYLDIERIRFGDRLRFRIQSLGNGLAPLVPRLSLQTLVENCVKYAVSPSREGASIAVVATSHNGRLHLAVEDDGPGFDVTQLPEGHGLQLLKSRLSMTFGDRAALIASSQPGHTVIALDLPFETVAPPTPVPELPPITQDRQC
jgi:signal transduction histidine kinase